MPKIPRTQPPRISFPSKGLSRGDSPRLASRIPRSTPEATASLTRIARTRQPSQVTGLEARTRQVPQATQALGALARKPVQTTQAPMRRERPTRQSAQVEPNQRIYELRPPTVTEALRESDVT